jgi:hypothetical protein
MAWQQPKTNWDTHPKAIEPADLNRIEGNIEVVREKSDLPLRLEVVDSFPSHAPGRAIYHTGNKMAYVSDGSSWMPFAAYDRGAMVFTPTIDDQTIPEGYHNGQGKVEGLRGKQLYEQAIASDNIKIYADQEQFNGSGTVIAKRIRLSRAGSYRVSFEGKAQSKSASSSIRLLVNGEQIASMGFYNNPNYNVYTEIITDFEVANPDALVEIELRVVGSNGVYVRNLRISFDIIKYSFPLYDDEVLLD